MYQQNRQIKIASLVALSVGAVGLLGAASCTDKRHDCTWLANCVTASGGEDSSAAGAAADPCAGKCPTARPICKTSSSPPACVQCSSNAQCAGSKRVCDSTGTCQQCLTNGDCSDPTPACSPATNTCVPCLESIHCKTAEASRCDKETNSCVPCQGDTDCSKISGKGVCLIETMSQAGQSGLTGPLGQTGQCVQCTGKSAAACGTVNGTALVCDSLKHECTTYTAASSGLCQACVSDAQCKPGQLCYQQTFAGSPVGYFCFYKQGDTDNGSPTDCTATTNRPYIKVQSAAVSIDNVAAPLCVPRASTCTALNQYSAVSCGTGTGPNDEICGFAPGTDSKCTAYGTVGQYRCTTSCITNDDCLSGATCPTDVVQRFCTQ